MKEKDNDKNIDDNAYDDNVSDDNDSIKFVLTLFLGELELSGSSHANMTEETMIQPRITLPERDICICICICNQHTEVRMVAQPMAPDPHPVSLAEDEQRVGVRHGLGLGGRGGLLLVGVLLLLLVVVFLTGHLGGGGQRKRRKGTIQG